MENGKINKLDIVRKDQEGFYLQDEKKLVEQNLETRTEDLSKAAQEYRKVVDAYKISQQKLKELSDGQENLVARNTEELKAELKTELDNELPIPYLFISSVAQQGITELKDKLWLALNK